MCVCEFEGQGGGEEVSTPNVIFNILNKTERKKAEKSPHVTAARRYMRKRAASIRTILSQPTSAAATAAARKTQTHSAGSASPLQRAATHVSSARVVGRARDALE